MPRYPGAAWKPININFQAGGNSPRLLVEHIMQGTLAGTDSWFRNPAARASAHFGVGKDGTVLQWVDTASVAWHAVAANHHSIGVEHEGDSGQVLTAAQLEADASLLAWATEHHPIPLQLAHDPGGSGLAYHALGGQAWGGHLACPGAPIVSQLGAILAAARQILAPPAPPPPAPAEEPDMILVQVDRATVPAGTAWPGVFLLDSSGTHHVTSGEAVKAYQSAGIKGPVTISWTEFLARGSTPLARS